MEGTKVCETCPYVVGDPRYCLLQALLGLNPPFTAYPYNYEPPRPQGGTFNPPCAAVKGVEHYSSFLDKFWGDHTIRIERNPNNFSNNPNYQDLQVHLINYLFGPNARKILLFLIALDSYLGQSEQSDGLNNIHTSGLKGNQDNVVVIRYYTTGEERIVASGFSLTDLLAGERFDPMVLGMCDKCNCLLNTWKGYCFLRAVLKEGVRKPQDINPYEIPLINPITGTFPKCVSAVVISIGESISLYCKNR